MVDEQVYLLLNTGSLFDRLNLEQEEELVAFRTDPGYFGEVLDLRQTVVYIRITFFFYLMELARIVHGGFNLQTFGES